MPAQGAIDPLPGEAVQLVAGDEFGERVAAKVSDRLHEISPSGTSKQPSRSGAAAKAGKATGGVGGKGWVTADASQVQGVVMVEEVVALARSVVAEMVGDGYVLVLNAADRGLAPVIGEVVKQVPGAVHARRQALSEQRIEALVDVYLPADPLAPALADIERDNAKAQARFLSSVPGYTAEQVAELAGHGSKNRSATASRWKAQRKIFGVRHAGRELYPAFQFKEGAPRPVIGAVLEGLPEDFSPWQTAFWFWGANGWLDGARPLDRLDETEAVVAAARRERDSWMG